MAWFGDLLKPGRSGRKAGDKIQRGVLAVAVVLLIAMIVVAILLAMTTRDGGAGLTSFVLFVAAGAVGAALGFLFGLPRARVSDLTGDSSAPTGPAPVAKASTYYLTNSNLIKVSDWLTTIVIGLGLVNITKIGPAVRELGHALEAPLGNAGYSGAVGVSVLLVGLLAGFILYYLWTSIRMRELLEDAERQNQQTVPEMRTDTVAQARQKADAKDLKLVVPPGTPDDATVVEQTLAAGTPVPRGTGLTVTMMAPTGYPPENMAPRTSADMPAAGVPSAEVPAAGVPSADVDETQVLPPATTPDAH
jgi:hypothetical protein